MKILLAIIISILIYGCGRIRHQAVSSSLQKILFEKSPEVLNKVDIFDGNLLKEFQEFEADKSKGQTFKTFEEGIYLMKLVNKEKIFYADKRAENAQGRMIETSILRNNPNSPLENVEKQMYLVFLDNERVILHAPTDKCDIRTGVETLDNNLNPAFKKKFVRQTTNYFKIGFYKDFNRVLKGYYKINHKNELLICLDNGFKGKKVNLIGYKCKINIDQNMAKSILVDEVYSKDEFIELSKNGLDNFELIKFYFEPQKLKMLLIKDKEHFKITKIEKSNSKLTYHLDNGYLFNKIIDSSGILIKVNHKKMK